MRRCRLVRALREHCAVIVRLMAHGLGLRQGLCPGKITGIGATRRRRFFVQGVKAKAYWRYVEPQTTRHCAKRQAVLARRPPRFSRPGREVRFLHLLVFTQSHAAEVARPRYARTLRDSFMRPRAAWAWATLGALPLKPHQGTEFPGPSTFLPPACVRSSAPFHAAIDAESAFPTSKYNSAKSPAYPRPPSASGIPLRPARTEGT